MRAKEFITEVTRITYGRDQWDELGSWGKESGRPEKTVQLPVNRIRVHEPDTKFDKPEFRQYLEQIKAALRRGEEIEPITVHRMPGEFLLYQVLDGHHRFKAYRELGLKKIPARIVHRFNVTHADQDVSENFADGKKPGRKGLAKRSGVNCKQSVTKLRQVAKNSTGEKRRMAHWCANMKSGKKS